MTLKLRPQLTEYVVVIDNNTATATVTATVTSVSGWWKQLTPYDRMSHVFNMFAILILVCFLIYLIVGKKRRTYFST